MQALERVERGVRVRVGSPDAPAVRALIAAYCLRYQIGGYEPMPGARWHVAVDEYGTAGALAYIDTAAHRFITDWYAVPGRRGKLASRALARIIRERPAVGWIVPSNSHARAWVLHHGGSETVVSSGMGEEIVVAIYLPAKGAA